MRARARFLAVIAGVVVLLLLMYFFMIRPRQGELEDLKAQVAAEESTTTVLELDLARLRSLQENSAELDAELAAIRELVPRKNQVANFLFLVQDAADESGVDFFSVTPELPKAPPEGAALAEVRIAINATGGFFSIQDFTRRLYDLDRALRIDLLGMTGQTDDEGDTIVELAITARIFFELPAGGGNTAPQPTETTTPTPEPTPEPSVSPLEPSPGGADSSPSENPAA